MVVHIKVLKHVPAFEPEIHLLGIYPKKITKDVCKYVYTYIHIYIFITVLRSSNPLNS